MQLIAYQLQDKKTLESLNLSTPIPLTFIVNPHISILDRTPEKDWAAEYESCESVPHYNALVKRAKAVQIRGWDLEGKDFKVKAEGFLARILQHEMDHLQGVMYTDKMIQKSLRHDKVGFLPSDVGQADSSPHNNGNSTLTSTKYTKKIQPNSHTKYSMFSAAFFRNFFCFLSYIK